MTTPLHELDIARLDRLIDLILTRDAAQIAAYVAPDLDRFMATHCTFGHAALLVFPVEHDDVLSALDHRGFRCSPIVPSTVVRERLRTRSGFATAPPVHIVHARKTVSDGSVRELEIFLAPAYLTDAAAHERRAEAESHVAFVPREPSDRTMRILRDALRGDGLVPDGGGFNPHENMTTLYFRRPRSSRYIYRLELACPGRHPRLLADHLDQPATALAAGVR
jgi:hypothetical protein